MIRYDLFYWFDLSVEVIATQYKVEFVNMDKLISIVYDS